jgi:hypothetical protein
MSILAREIGANAAAISDQQSFSAFSEGKINDKEMDAGLCLAFNIGHRAYRGSGAHQSGGTNPPIAADCYGANIVQHAAS